MENNTLYTRCPTCTTAFKVTEKLLTVAAGKVRCGACLAIFQATDYMLKPSERNNSAEPAVPKQPDQAEQASSEVETNDQKGDSANAELGRSQLTPEPKTEKTEEQILTSDQPTNSDEYESEPQFEASDHPTEPLDFEPEPDFEDELPLEQEPDFQAHSAQHDFSTTEPSADPEIDLDVVTDVDQDYLSTSESHQPTTKQPQPAEDNQKISDLDYDSQSFEFNEEPAEFDQVLESPEQDEQIEPEAQTEFDVHTALEEQTEANRQADSQLESLQQPQRTEPSLGDTHNIEAHNIDEIEDIVPTTDDLTSDDLTSDSQEILDATTDVSSVDLADPEVNLVDQNEPFEPIPDMDHDALIDEPEVFDVDDLSGQLAEQMQDTDAEPDPLDEFEDIVEEKNTDLRRNIIIAAVAILVFVGFQQVWSNRQALAWSDSWGSTIKSVCQYLPCDLKARRDVSKIKLLQRQLAPDEENENQLDVKVLLTNEASFDQPYPTIKIAFSNKNGEQVSVKSFLPQDYLEPDSVNKLMPNGTEVHIHFKTELTHPDALGFEFIFE